MDVPPNQGVDKIAPPSNDLLLPPPPAPSSPWLVSPHSNGNQQTFYVNISEPSSAVEAYCKSIPALEDKQVLSCSYGWLVLYDHTNKLLSFCNSTTFADNVVLPPLTQVSKHGVSSCVLVPNNNITCFNKLDNFKIVIFLKEFPAILCGQIGGAGDEGWTTYRYSKMIKFCIRDPKRRYLIFRRAVVCGGKIFAELGAAWLFNTYFCCIEINFEDKICQFSRISEEYWGDPNNDPDALLRSKKTYVVESCGELFFIFFWSANLVFDLYRVNLENMEWEKIRYLDDRSFFIGKNYCVSCPGSGCIYFTTKTRDGNLYCFHMKDHSVSVSPLSTTPWLRHPIWIMPRILLRPEDDDHNNITNQTRNYRPKKKMKLDENRDENKALCSLPLDVLEHLASQHLIAKEYMNFRATSRICRSVAPPVNWKKALSASSEAASYVFHCPLLMFADQNESIYKFVDPSINSINHNHYFMKIPNPLLDHKTIRYSSHGWVLLSERHTDILIYNPFTEDIITYNSKAPAFSSESLFFFPKSSVIGIDNDAHSFCHVVSFGLVRPNKVFVSSIDDPQAEEWTHIVYVNGRNLTLLMPVFFEDAFYALDREGILGKLEIDFEARVGSWEVLDKPQKPTLNNCFDLSFHNSFLVECGGELISVFLGSLGKWIAVYKLNSDKDWEIVTNLGSYDLYLSATSCLSVKSRSKEGGNRIYFAAVRGDFEIVYFSLNTNKWHFSGKEDSTLDICGTRWLANSCWIKPTW